MDDFADDVSFTRKSVLLHQLCIRGRHQMISTIPATQVYKAISPLVRQNMTDLYIYRLRNQAELDAIAEEVRAVYDKQKTKIILEMTTIYFTNSLGYTRSFTEGYLISILNNLNSTNTYFSKALHELVYIRISLG